MQMKLKVKVTVHSFSLCILLCI
ncbi:TPA: hypothetical protein ACNVDL_001362 [Morganella morganii]